jgi:O-antigen ligase
MIIFSLSRGAYIATGISLPLGVVLILALWRERQIVPMLAALLLVIALVTPFTAHLLADRLTRSLDTLTGRLPVYWTAWRVFTDYPLFGIGPGNWTYIYPHYDRDRLIVDWYSNLVHNDILLNAVELGVFGSVPYIGMILSATLRLFNLARRRRDLAGRLAPGVLIALIASEMTNQVDPGLHEPSVALLFWIFIALSVALPLLRPGAGATLMVRAGRPKEGRLHAPGMPAGGAAGGGGD